jgi:hypothetical protein
LLGSLAVQKNLFNFNQKKNPRNKRRTKKRRCSNERVFTFYHLCEEDFHSFLYKDSDLINSRASNKGDIWEINDSQ